MPVEKEDYTLGVEEEYQVIDPETRALCPGAEDVLRRARRTLGEDRVVPELRASQLEVVTPVCRTLSEVRGELLRLRWGVIRAAEEAGVRIAAASTHPFSHWQDQPITAGERYEKILDRERRMAEEQVVFGFHVHVGLSDREAAVQTMNRARLWLAPLLALSANSPFWMGEDTGYASYRTQIWGWLPTAGPPGPFSSLAEHDALVESLVATGGAMEANQVYWDMRLPQKLETVEIRVCDVCSSIDEAVMLAGLCRALVRTCHKGAEEEKPYPEVRPEILRAAHWVASRYGLGADLVDVEAGHLAPAKEVIEKLLAFTRRALEEYGDWKEVSVLVGDTLKRGNGAVRQCQVYERSGKLGDVVDALIEDTAKGTNAS
ncbi:MAG TPA: glutamate--cysteine ligase [Rubrobacteraceae bacterium]|nr:glutamate--cysteine ligase [Rubrobacteraceae bacterium]